MRKSTCQKVSDLAAVPQPALTSLLKDKKNVKSQDFLLLHDLDDIAGVRETYLISPG